MLLITYLWVGLYVDILSVYQTKLDLHNGATALRGARVHGYSRGMEVNVCQGRTREGEELAGACGGGFEVKFTAF